MNCLSCLCQHQKIAGAILIGTYAAIVFLAGCSKPGEPEVVPTIACQDLRAEYKSDPVKADEKYKGKLVTVSGVVRDKLEDFYSTRWARLVATQGDIVPLVDCEMVAVEHDGSVCRGSQAEYHKLNEKETVAIQGRCMGLKPGRGTSTVVLNECKVVDIKEPPSGVKSELDGHWELVSFHISGRPNTQFRIFWIFRNTELIEDMRYMKFGGGVDQTHKVGPFELKMDEKPKQIDIKLYSEQYALSEQRFGIYELAYGIYELDGNKLTVCMQGSAGKRPTDFTTKDGSFNQLLVFERVAEEKPLEKK